MKFLLPTLALLALIAVACSGHQKKETKEPDEMALTPTPSKDPKTDQEIVNALMTVNTEEMQLARVARTNATNQKVKNFAEMMFKEHSRSNDRIAQMRRSEELNLRETKSSMKLKFTSEEEVERLKGMKGRDFDRAYMQTQVDMHEKVLEKLDSTLIPNAQNEKLRAMLQETRQSVEKHHHAAKNIQSSLR